MSTMSRIFQWLPRLRTRLPLSPALPPRTWQDTTHSRSELSQIVGRYVSEGAMGQRRGVLTRFNFDTYKLVRQLERQNLSRPQAVAIMRTVNALLVDTTLNIRAAMLSRPELENETFAYKNSLADLRSELGLLRQNDTAQLRSETEGILRETESLSGQWTEQLGALKAEVSVDMNNRKADVRDHSKTTELKIQDINHKLVIRLAELKTAMERTKMETTKRIVWVALTSLGGFMVLDYALPSHH